MSLPELAGSKPGKVQQALGRAVVDCVENELGWRKFAVAVKKQTFRWGSKAELAGKPSSVDTESLARFVRLLANGRPSPLKTRADGLDRLLDLLAGGQLEGDREVKNWELGPRPTEATFKQQALEPFICRHPDELHDLDVVAPPWAKRGGPTKRCPKHGGAEKLNCQDCWTASKAWASVHVFGKPHSFDLVAKQETPDEDRGTPSDKHPAEALVVEVKLASRLSTRPDVRFIGQLLLARSKHDRVVGVYAVLPAPHGQFSPDELGAARQTQRIADRLGVRFVPIDLAGKAGRAEAAPPRR